MSPPKYDFTAAANLDSVLTATIKALQDLTGKRTLLWRTDLGDPGASPPPYYLWQGKSRTDFEAEFGPQQKALQALINQLTDIQRQVRQATNAATARTIG